MSHFIQFGYVQVRDNLTIEASPLRIEDREGKHLRGKDIYLVKVVWKGPVEGSEAWELESWTRESYPKLFLSGGFRGQTFFKGDRVVTPWFFCLLYFNLVLEYFKLFN